MTFDQFVKEAEKTGCFVSAEFTRNSSRTTSTLKVETISNAGISVKIEVTGMRLLTCYDEALKIINVVSSDPVL